MLLITDKATMPSDTTSMNEKRTKCNTIPIQAHHSITLFKSRKNTNTHLTFLQLPTSEFLKECILAKIGQ